MAHFAKRRRLDAPGRGTPRVESFHSDIDRPVDFDPPSDDTEDEDEDERGRNAQSYSTLLKSLGAKTLQTEMKRNETLSVNGKSNKKKGRSHTHGNGDTNGHSANGVVREEALEDQENASAGNLYEGSEEENEIDGDHEGDSRDPFEHRFASLNTQELALRAAAIESRKWATEKHELGGLGRMTVQHLSGHEAPNVQQRFKSTAGIYLKKKLRQTAPKRMADWSDLESQLSPTMFSYTDLLFGCRNPENAEQVRRLTALHILNHLMKTRDRVIKNNARLTKERESNQELELRDQGFTRPKILILLETRQMCARYIEALVDLYEPEQQENKKRFLDAFTVETEKYEPGSKPPDFLELFEGNNDNEFRLGLKLTRKNLKLYSQFYSSDIIFASPLGLRRAIDGGDKGKRKDYDFLSSIEIAVVDQADAMAMQNWSHVTHALSYLNLTPQSPHGCDFSRVREWSLNGHAKHVRQTLVFANYLTPEINALFSLHMNNAYGKVKIQPVYSGAMLASASTPFGTRVKQTFQRFQSLSASADPDERFKFFTTAILPSLARLVPTAESTAADAPGILLFTPDYFDYTRLRSLFSATANNVSMTASALAETFAVAHLTEYSTSAEANRAMSHFAAGRAHVLLYTGRAHHFRRYRRIRGVKRVVFYGVPENAAFWGEMVDQVVKGVVEGKTGEGEGEVRCLFSRWDGLALERIVGSERVGGMLRQGSGGDVFEFR